MFKIDLNLSHKTCHEQLTLSLLICKPIHVIVMRIDMFIELGTYYSQYNIISLLELYFGDILYIFVNSELYYNDI